MKKQTLLSLATAGAIITTSAVSFAAWDVTEGKAKGTLTIANPVDIQTQDMAAFALDGTHTIGTTPSYTSDVSFTVETSDLANTLTLGTVIKNGEIDVTKNFEVAYTEKNAGTGLNGLVDTAIVDGANGYTVTITPKDTAEAKALAAQPLNVEVSGTLSQV